MLVVPVQLWKVGSAQLYRVGCVAMWLLHPSTRVLPHLQLQLEFQALKLWKVLRHQGLKGKVTYISMIAADL